MIDGRFRSTLLSRRMWKKQGYQGISNVGAAESGRQGASGCSLLELQRSRADSCRGSSRILPRILTLKAKNAILNYREHHLQDMMKWKTFTPSEGKQLSKIFNSTNFNDMGSLRYLYKYIEKRGRDRSIEGAGSGRGRHYPYSGLRHGILGGIAAFVIIFLPIS